MDTKIYKGFHIVNMVPLCLLSNYYVKWMLHNI